MPTEQEGDRMLASCFLDGLRFRVVPGPQKYVKSWPLWLLLMV